MCLKKKLYRKNMKDQFMIIRESNKQYMLINRIKLYMHNKNE